MPHQGYESYLKQALSKYRNPDTTKRDVLQTLQHFRGLFPKLETFVFNDGTQKELLNLDGTIPVHYKGNTYNIPVCIWMLDTHAYDAPMCFVKPTSDMQIKTSKHVDQNGKVYLPYLHNWKHNTSDLLGLIQMMILVFEEQPPVYSKARTHTEPATAQPTQPAAPQSHSSTPYPTGTQSYMPVPTPRSSQITAPGPAPPLPSHGYPPYPPATGMYPPVTSGYGYQGSYAGGGGYSYPPTNAAPSYIPGYPPTSSAYAAPAPYPTYPATSLSQPPQPPAPLNLTNPTNNTITEAHIRASLMSAVEDKLKRRLREVYAQAQAEMDVLKRTQDDLNQGKVKLEDIINRLEQEQLDLEKNIIVLKEKNEAMNELICKMEKQEAIDVDEAVVTVAPLYKQLLNAFAEENAIEDAIYYLGEALRKQVIDLDVFLKHVRELSRRQFMLRALVQKCREKANLPC